MIVRVMLHGMIAMTKVFEGGAILGILDLIENKRSKGFQKMQFRERDVLMVYLEDMKKIMIENNKKSEKTKMILVTRLCGAGHAWGECV